MGQFAHRTLAQLHTGQLECSHHTLRQLDQPHSHHTLRQLDQPHPHTTPSGSWTSHTLTPHPLAAGPATPSHHTLWQLDQPHSHTTHWQLDQPHPQAAGPATPSHHTLWQLDQPHPHTTPSGSWTSHTLTPHPLAAGLATLTPHPHSTHTHNKALSTVNTTSNAHTHCTYLSNALQLLRAAKFSMSFAICFESNIPQVDNGSQNVPQALRRERKMNKHKPVGDTAASTNQGKNSNTPSDADRNNICYNSMYVRSTVESYTHKHTSTHTLAHMHNPHRHTLTDADTYVRTYIHIVTYIRM